MSIVKYLCVNPGTKRCKAVEKKPVGEKAEPTAEELEFIYSHLMKLSDQEVLEEMQDTEFPVRSLGFIKRRRREFNVARKVLESTLKEQEDPILAKAKAEHLDEVRNLIERWMEASTTPAFHEVDLHTEFPVERLESQPLFGCLKEHIQSETLWETYGVWRARFGAYLAMCQSLIKEIRQAGKYFESLAGSMRGFERPILRRLNDKALGKEVIPYAFQVIRGAGRIVMRKGDYLYIDGEVLLLVSDGEKGSREYQRISEGFLNSEALANLTAAFSELRSLEFEIRSRLLETLTSRNYRNFTCRLCPGQSSESS